MRCRRAISSYTTYTLTYIAYLSVYQRDNSLGVGGVGGFLPFSRVRVRASAHYYKGINL